MKIGRSIQRGRYTSVSSERGELTARDNETVSAYQYTVNARYDNKTTRNKNTTWRPGEKCNNIKYRWKSERLNELCLSGWNRSRTEVPGLAFFLLLSPLLDIHISTWKDAAVWNLAGRQERWVGGAANRWFGWWFRAHHWSYNGIMSDGRRHTVHFRRGGEEGRKVGLTRCVVVCCKLAAVLLPLGGL